LKLDFDELLSSFAFRFNLRRYTKELSALSTEFSNNVLDATKAGACTRSQLSST